MANVRRLHRAGVAITAGTDAPLYNLKLGESVHRELELLVEAGLSPMEALQAATSRPARMVQRAASVGTIEVGMRADLIAVAGDPLRTIANTRRCASSFATGGSSTLTLSQARTPAGKSVIHGDPLCRSCGTRL